MKKNLYSFSQLSTFEQCPLQWKYTYLDKLPREENIWSLIGTTCHELIEQLIEGSINNIMAAEMFNAEYDNIIAEYDFPFNNNKLKESYRNKITAYFENYKDFKGTVREVEMYFEILVNKTDEEEDYLRGYIDLPLIYNDEGFIIDHKISTPYKGETLNKKKKQLYIYAEAYFQKYGEYPKFLMFNYLKDRESFVEKFNPAYLEFTMKWVRNMIERIKNEKEYSARIDKGFCSNLCPFRNICEPFIQHSTQN